MKISSKPAQRAALAALILSASFFMVIFLLGRWSGFFALYALSFLLLSAAIISLVLLIQFQLRTMAEQEKLDSSLIEKATRDSTIFQTRKEHPELFAIAQNRLRIFEKWFLPAFAAAIAAYQLLLGYFLLKSAYSADVFQSRDPLICAVVATTVAFASFLLSRYVTGMSAQLQWKPLRAAGSNMVAVALLAFSLAVALALANFKVYIGLKILNYIIPAILAVLGLETALNCLLDIYRPRIKGRYCHAAFDSRLLATINEPGNIFRTAASAIDYQFGFKVSQTWFYKLLEKAVIPLLLFAAAVLYAFSSIVIVQPDQQAIIERFGNPFAQNGTVRLAKPGITLKWPWPIDNVHSFSTEKISQISIGYTPNVDAETNQVIHEKSLIWGQAHYKEEHNLLVAAEQSDTQQELGAVPVSLVKAAVPVQYRVKNLSHFLYNHKNSEKVLEAICYRQLAKLAANSIIEVDYSPTQKTPASKSLLGSGLARAQKSLTENIQKAADKAKLGVEIVLVAIEGIHPPPEVASKYEQVIGSVQTKLALILSAQAQQNKILGSLTGSVEEAEKLAELAKLYRRTEESDKEQKRELAEKLDTALKKTGGTIFTTLRDAQAYAYQKATLAKWTGRRFRDQLKAYNAAPNIYQRRQRLLALEETMKDIRKFVVVADPNDTQIYIVDVKEKLTPSLYDLTGLEELEQK